MIQTAVRTQLQKRIPALRVVGLLLVLVTVAALLQPVGARAAGALGLAAVTAPTLSLRQTASNYARVVAVLARGDIVKVTVVSGSWSKVLTTSGQSGWCASASMASAASATAFKTASVSSMDWPTEYIDLVSAFTYQRCIQDMGEIVRAYPGQARIVTIGTSVMGNPINAIVLGKPNAQTRVLFQASIHARESISALLALRQVECLLKSAKMGAAYKGMKITDLLQNVEIWVVPMSNPDGVRLIYEGLKAVPTSMPQLAASLKTMNSGSTDFQRWKANGRGVDLNSNFDAGWAIDSDYKKPGPYYYSGPKPFSEPESIALRDLTAAKDFALTMSYHSSGEVIYWYNQNGGREDLDLFIANNIKALTGYTVLTKPPQAFSGGYRDWFVNKYKRPGYTLEIGTGYCPLPQSQFPTYWEDDRFVMVDLAWTVTPKSLSALVK